MIKKEIRDYVPEITQEVNEYYKGMGLEIVFKEKEVEKILTIVMNNLSTALMKKKDVHIAGFFRIVFSKQQLGYQRWFANGKRKVFYKPSYKEQMRDFFAN